ncbi:hypothetical protein [Actinosynnema sp. NPDC020468]|uniref:hypothetical protein n=1 Tax=Actinosynnema sp. NPDC020468 TaxID=3154488 RepID=UPI0033FD4ABA
MIDIGSRARGLPAPPHVVWRSLVEPRRPGTRPWLTLLPDEVDPAVVAAEEHHHVVWSSLWPNRPDVRVHFALTATEDGGTSLRFTLLSPVEPDASATGHLRRRLNRLLFADLRFSYGQ